MVEYGDREHLRRNLKTHSTGAYFMPIAVEAVRRDSRLWYPDRRTYHPRTSGKTHDTMVAQAEILSDLPLATLKIHQLQLIRGTRMAMSMMKLLMVFICLTREEYIDLVIDYVEHLSRYSCGSPFCFPIS